VANLSDGVLTITLPKVTPKVEKKNRIEISGK
jgi:HSP20 family molecular chaperone IbpA